MDTSEADDELVKDVFAHFGLALYLVQVFETGLINALTVLVAAESGKPRAVWEETYTRHETLTFGNLLRSLSRRAFFTPTLEQEILALKSERDGLAHGFFRRHTIRFNTVSGCQEMIAELIAFQERIQLIGREVDELERKSLLRLGFNLEQIDAMISDLTNEMLDDARAGRFEL